MTLIKDDMKAGFINLHRKDKYCIKDLTPKQLIHMVELTGIVLKISDVIPEMKSAVFKCAKCDLTVRVDLCNARVEEPKRC